VVVIVVVCRVVHLSPRDLKTPPAYKFILSFAKVVSVFGASFQVSFSFSPFLSLLNPFIVCPFK